MIVYSVHPESVYKLMREQGFLEGNKEFAMFPHAYDWMIDQMKKRLPNYDGENYPVWIWKRRVNRNEKGLVGKNQRGVILKLDIPEKDILWSSFDEWHIILNQSPIVYDEFEWNEMKEKGFPKEDVINTWDRLFDYDWLSKRQSEWSGNYNKHWIQGVTSRITIEQVKRVERFIGK